MRKFFVFQMAMTVRYTTLHYRRLKTISQLLNNFDKYLFEYTPIYVLFINNINNNYLLKQIIFHYKNKYIEK